MSKYKKLIYYIQVFLFLTLLMFTCNPPRKVIERCLSSVKLTVNKHK